MSGTGTGTEKMPLLDNNLNNPAMAAPALGNPHTTTTMTLDANANGVKPTTTTNTALGGVVGGGAATTTAGAAGPTTAVAVPLPAKFAKPSRPRKAVAEFRKKTRHVPSWTGRVGVHLHVDEINIVQLQVDGWKVVDHYDVVRLWQEEPPFVGQEFMTDWPLSEDEDNAAGKNNYNPNMAIPGGTLDVNTAMPEVYAFSFGAVVFWNFPNEQYEEQWMKENILNKQQQQQQQQQQPQTPTSPINNNNNNMNGINNENNENNDTSSTPSYHSPEEIESASDNISFQYGETFGLKRDVCTLSSRDPGVKLAISFALAKSSLLSIYELRVQQLIERNSHIPEMMVQHGRVHMKHKEMSQEVGRLFLVKHAINLDQSLIDTPEEFWEDDRFEPIYDTALKYFEISKRLSLVNSRLDMIGELHNKILEEHQNHHAAVLEWIIILLIVVEVLLDMLHLGFY